MYMEEKLDMLMDMVMELNKKIDAMNVKGVMSVADIAEYTGISKNTLYTTKRYMLPNFGEVEEGGKMEWTKAEVMRWLGRDMEKLKSEFRKKQATVRTIGRDIA